MPAERKQARASMHKGAERKDEGAELGGECRCSERQGRIGSDVSSQVERRGPSLRSRQKVSTVLRRWAGARVGRDSSGAEGDVLQSQPEGSLRRRRVKSLGAHERGRERMEVQGETGALQASAGNEPASPDTQLHPRPQAPTYLAAPSKPGASFSTRGGLKYSFTSLVPR